MAQCFSGERRPHYQPLAGSHRAIPPHNGAQNLGNRSCTSAALRPFQWHPITTASDGWGEIEPRACPVNAFSGGPGRYRWGTSTLDPDVERSGLLSHNLRTKGRSLG